MFKHASRVRMAVGLLIGRLPKGAAIAAHNTVQRFPRTRESTACCCCAAQFCTMACYVTRHCVFCAWCQELSLSPVTTYPKSVLWMGLSWTSYVLVGVYVCVN